MSAAHLYEYAVIRAVPRVEREEFINVGIILFCKREKYIRVQTKVNDDKLRCFTGDLDHEQLFKNLEAFQKIALGEKNCGPIAEMDIAERFRWLTAVRSSSIQTSRPHPGMSKDLDQTFERLFIELVA
jgi:hypothetical protein